MFRDHPKPQLILFARAAANVVASDHSVTHEERLELDNVVEGIGLRPNDEEVVAAIEAELKAPGDLTAIVSGIEGHELRVALLRMLIELSATDGHVEAAEKAKVAEAARAFGIDDAVAEELFVWTLDSIALEKREEELMGKLLG